MAFTRPVVGSDISAADFGQPVYDEVTRMTPLVVAPTAWVQMTLTNGWTQSASPVSYLKAHGFLVFRGSMNAGTIGAAFFTLPVGFRPVFTMTVPVYAWTTGGNFMTELSVNSNGTCTIDTALTHTPSTVGLNGTTLYLD